MNRTLARKIVGAVWPLWKIVSSIGGGGYGTVYHAVNDKNERLTSAIKIIPIPDESLANEISQKRAEGCSEDDILDILSNEAARAEKEATAMIELRDSGHIVSIQDFAILKKADIPGMDDDEEGYYLLIRMEELISLTKYSASRGGMTEKEILEMGIELCNALKLCERKNIIHRDIKPDNILIQETSEGVVFFKLGDFGIARNYTSTDQTKTGRIGTPAFMSPEVANGGSYDNRSDIYSLALTLYMLLNRGALPFAKDTSAEEAERAKNLLLNPPRPAIPRPEQASQRTAEALLKALAFRKEDRYSTAAEFQQALKAALKETERPAVITKQPDEPVPAPPIKPTVSAVPEPTAKPKQTMPGAPKIQRAGESTPKNTTQRIPRNDAAPHALEKEQEKRRKPTVLIFFAVLALLAALSAGLLSLLSDDGHNHVSPTPTESPTPVLTATPKPAGTAVPATTQISTSEPAHASTAVPAEETRKKGDINGDGTLDQEDYVLMVRCLQGDEDPQFSAHCDLNGDGLLDQEDYVTLVRLLQENGGEN